MGIASQGYKQYAEDSLSIHNKKIEQKQRFRA